MSIPSHPLRMIPNHRECFCLQKEFTVLLNLTLITGVSHSTLLNQEQRKLVRGGHRGQEGLTDKKQPPLTGDQGE